MAMFVEGPDGLVTQFMFDDGAHLDGSAGDGIFGATFAQNDLRRRLQRAYSGRLQRYPMLNPANTALRGWNGGFWIRPAAG